MKRLVFYCQHILGIGHLIRSMEIVRGLTRDFQVCFINGGEIIQGFRIPAGVEVVNLPPLKTDVEFHELQVPEGFDSVESVFQARKQQLLELCDRIQPDVLMVELFPFGRRRFSAEIIPMIECAQGHGAKIVSSLRDIVVTKQDQARHEAKVCKLMNRYFDLLLIHGDPQFMPLERSFSRIYDLKCPVYYTGYVVQRAGSINSPTEVAMGRDSDSPLILTSVGGGRFGHDLLRCVAHASRNLESLVPHQIRMFAGPFCPEEVFEELRAIATKQPNLAVERYTPNLLSYMQQATLSISMAGYNTTMNVLTTGVRSMLLPFTGNDDQEQTIRSERLEELGIVSVIRAADLEPERFAQRIVDCLKQTPASMQFNLRGVENTAAQVRSLCEHSPSSTAA
jgi:predicted glycosyltransferase